MKQVDDSAQAYLMDHDPASLEQFLTQLQQSELLLDQLPIPYLILDEKLNIVFCTYEFASLLGLSLKSIDPFKPRQTFAKYINSNLRAFIDWIADEHSIQGFEILLHTSLEARFIAFRRTQSFGRKKLYHLKCVPSEQFLLLNSEVNVYKTVFNHVDKAVFITDQNGKIQTVNPKFTELLGYEARVAVGRRFDYLFDDKGRLVRDEIEIKLLEQNRWRGRVSLITQSQGTMTFSLSVILPAANVEQLERVERVYIAESIEDQLDLEDELKKRAETDALTQLHNRTAFNRYFTSAFTEAQRTGDKLSLMFIDLDSFKRLNDSYGHDKGDMLLKMLSERLLNCIRSSDFVARLGGDEFIIMLEGEMEERFLAGIAEKILAAINAPFQLGDLLYQSSVSIGIAAYPQDALDESGLLRAADSAMYVAKKNGRNRFHFYDNTELKHENKGPEIRDEITQALASGAIKAFYQPIHNIETGRVVGFEALARLVLSDDDIRLPGYFLPHIQGDALMLQLGMHIASLVFAMADILVARGYETYITLNLSADQLRSVKLIDHLELLTTNHPTGRSLVKVEITEVVLFEDDEQVALNIEKLIGLGLDIVLDDFGTGYASILALKKFNFSAIKIDRNFIRDIQNPKSVSLLEGMISLLQSLSLDIVCEGIEQESQLQFLREHGCTLGQGFYYAKAFPKTKLLKYYRDHC
ncbi:EAL domain-containing protein [Amphritea sp. 1_MG-2023]|uniref:putative bifunctional diguanylate cyclase/phosphodiesterase n=1 Tax=Amphritea sp. 1_MG-2023 TaxID=3062670 RepID=UPI0026E161A0|nr:EAL domain-containing protein [Amphritea sp. 1_MG-2023]MDO6563670.1 EAL domain-containing protein [Amphritea sp. 1_MG-2023]